MVSSEVEGRSHLTSGAGRAKARRNPIAHLLPNYDEYFIGQKDRSAIGQRLKRAGLRWPEGSTFWNVVAVDGQLVGGWKRVMTGKRIRIDMKLLVRPKPNERKAIAHAADSYAQFLGPHAFVRMI